MPSCHLVLQVDLATFPISSAASHGSSRKPFHLSCLSLVGQLSALAEVLSSCKEFGFDLEAHNARTYHGLSCLLQISTEAKVQLNM